MTAKCALIQHLLSGKVINIKNCFELIGLTNAPREISRSVEKPFGIIVTRIPRTGKSRYGQPCTWYDYKLERTNENFEGIQKAAQYIAENGGLLKTGAKTEKEAKKQDKPKEPPKTLKLVQNELF
jgi:hypothetical protein